MAKYCRFGEISHKDKGISTNIICIVLFDTIGLSQLKMTNSDAHSRMLLNRQSGVLQMKDH